MVCSPTQLVAKSIVDATTAGERNPETIKERALAALRMTKRPGL
jgi:hypothetical protein